ncbi:MAG TPA: cation:proton antiporter [Candidatus Latescibacteria bacterium]|nr:cation:proton antiporter [Candidatus Latescibacterota bacterium]|tara:strand:+ start:2849 stop:4354 length:1506 start_codon:yes stop_codon:yes gene_type:complete
MTPQIAIVLSLLLPVVACPIIALVGTRPNVRDTVSFIAGLLTFGTVLTLLPYVQSGVYPELSLFDVLPGVSLAFKVEPLGMLFGLVASGLWIVTGLYGVGYMRGHHEVDQTRFFFFFAFAITAALGVAFAGNLLTLFIFYEVLTLSTYPLVTHARTPEALRGGRIYLGILLSTSVAFLLLAVLWTYFAAGTLDFTPGGILAGKVDTPALYVLLGLFAFGTGKAALMPFHRWLPAAMVAPTPVSALLHAVAVVKAGVFTVLKVLIYIFGIDLLHDTGASVWLMYVAGGTVLIASLVAMTKDNLKARLAYSTVSQLAYIVLGAALATPLAVIGGGMHIVMHAFGKITLFFCAGAINVALHKTEVSDMRGIGRQMPFTMFAFLIGTLSVIGLPPMGGAWSKWYLFLGALKAEQMVFVVVLMVSSLLNIAYLLPIPIRAFFQSAEPAAAGADVTETDHHDGGMHEAPFLCVAPLMFTALGCIALFFWAGPVYRLLAPIVSGGPGD